MKFAQSASDLHRRSVAVGSQPPRGSLLEKHKPSMKWAKHKFCGAGEARRRMPLKKGGRIWRRPVLAVLLRQKNRESSRNRTVFARRALRLCSAPRYCRRTGAAFCNHSKRVQLDRRFHRFRLLVRIQRVEKTLRRGLFRRYGCTLAFHSSFSSLIQKISSDRPSR